MAGKGFGWTCSASEAEAFWVINAAAAGGMAMGSFRRGECAGEGVESARSGAAGGCGLGAGGSVGSIGSRILIGIGRGGDLFLDVEEAGDELAEFAVQALLVAIQQNEGVVGIIREAMGEDAAGVGRGAVGAGRDFGGLDVEEVVFGLLDAAELPGEVDDAVEEGELDGVAGAEVAFQFVAEGGEGGGAFAGEDGGVGADAVLEGVEAGAGFALGRARAGGFQGVGAVGGETAWGDGGRVWGLGFRVGGRGLEIGGFGLKGGSFGVGGEKRVGEDHGFFRWGSTPTGLLRRSIGDGEHRATEL